MEHQSEKEYSIEVTEVLSRVITVKAKDYMEAMELVRDMYDTQEIVLDAEDFMGVDFKPYEMVREQHMEKYR